MTTRDLKKFLRVRFGVVVVLYKFLNVMTTDWQSFCERGSQADTSSFGRLFDKYSDQLVRLASQNIHPALKKRFDGEDVVQSAFRTFFRRQQEGKFQVEREQQLWRLLVTITICKTRSAARRHLAAKRNVHVEQLLPDESDFRIQEASPGDAMALLEEIDAAMQGLPDRAAEILAARLEGKSKTEIASEFNLTRQTIHRILKLVEERLSERFELVIAADSSTGNSATDNSQE
jgi:RNA polymerase sigma-70 factor (ECF subfamily)